jgi:hypothetical protein
MITRLRLKVNLKKWRLVLMAVLLVLVNLPMFAEAASTPVTRSTAPLDLSTSPLPISLAAKPGQTVSTYIKVKQAGGDTEQLQVHLLKFSAYGTSGQPALSERGPGDDYFDWVTFDKPVFTAPNNVWQSIKMTIKLPTTAAFEYNYAVEFTRVGDTLPVQGRNIEGIAGGTAVLVLLDAQAPGEMRSLQLTSFGVQHRVVEFLPTTFQVNLYNNGNTYIQPTGDIFITQNNHQVGTVLLNDENGNILAKTHRIYSTVWADGFPYYEPLRIKDRPDVDKHGNPIMTLNWNLPTNTEASNNNGDASTTDVTEQTESTNPLSRLRFGEYTARLVVVYQDGYGRDVPITSTMSFWVIPWRILLVFLLILLVIGFGIYSAITGAMRRNRRIQRLKRKKR